MPRLVPPVLLGLALALSGCEVNVDNNSQAAIDDAGDALGNAADAAGSAVGNVADAAGTLAEKGAAKVENAADAVGNTHVNVNLDRDGGGNNAAEGNHH
jgi:hypothetical protein